MAWAGLIPSMAANGFGLGDAGAKAVEGVLQDGVVAQESVEVLAESAEVGVFFFEEESVGGAGARVGDEVDGAQEFAFNADAREVGFVAHDKVFDAFGKSVDTVVNVALALLDRGERTRAGGGGGLGEFLVDAGHDLGSDALGVIAVGHNAAEIAPEAAAVDLVLGIEVGEFEQHCPVDVRQSRRGI